MCDEIHIARRELQRAQDLARDAMARLARGFSVLGDQAHTQRALIQTLRNSLSHGGGGGGSDDPDTARDDDAGNPRVDIQSFATETSHFLTGFTDLLANVSKQSVRTVYRIDDMARELEAVFKLVASIDEIAQETFILAVNATIEAAHAGTAGRSFAVIASNVRDLAQKTQRFNDQIGSQVGTAQGTVREVRQIIAEMASRDMNAALSGKDRITQMFEQLRYFDSFVAGTLKQVDGAAMQIQATAAEATPALESDRGVEQLLAGAQDRLSRIEALCRRGGGAHEIAKLQDPIRGQPLVQGKVELF